MFSETAYSSQTKLIGEGLHVSEHGIGYLNLAFYAKKGQKRPILGFKPLKRLEGLEILEHKCKNVYNKESFRNRQFSYELYS